MLALPICSFCWLGTPLSIAEIVPSILIPRGSGWTVNYINCLATEVAVDFSLDSHGKPFHCSYRFVQGMGTRPMQGHLESLHII